ncbi:HNH endonuclease [Catenulispora sp. MAP5-51]|uniref:HNH endonuclease n=1 Tax=Catenulispora sp. MAP5-51 TaxID=3156298 RepID=UPI00351613FB
MGLTDVTAEDIRTTIEEYDRLGQQAFLSQYRYGKSTGYLLLHEGRTYDSKAIAGVAHQVSNGYPLTPEDFSGGERTVVRLLKSLGFSTQPVRDPAWTRDEIILACALVVENDWRRLEGHDRKCVELSQILRRADLHPAESRSPDFRSPDSVARKTVDIFTRRGAYTGKPTHGNRLDGEVLQAFERRTDAMLATARAIREAIADPDERGLGGLADVDLDQDVAADEGQILVRRHLTRERDPRLRGNKVESVRRETGRVACQACGFDFARIYGDRDADFIECHHVVPLHVGGPRRTRLSDLVLLCANCHRMIHRRSPWLTFEQLCELVEAHRG